MTTPAVHVMLDLETLSTRKNAAIIQIAAIAFDPSTGATLPASFNAFVNDLHQDSHVDISTIAWWLQQDQAARLGAAIEQQGITLGRALLDFSQWYAALGAVEAIWSHGATFDLPVLCSALASCGYKQPWSYRAERDTRTLFALAPGGMPAVVGTPGGQKHDALYDCEIQIKQVVGALAALRGAAAV
jgi:exodeoxyribonuclease VIII